MPTTYITPTKLTLSSAGAWVDVDLSSLIPAGSTGVGLHVLNLLADTYLGVGFRKKGSTDNRIEPLYGEGHFWVPGVGVDANRVIQLYAEDTTKIEFWLVAAHDSDCVFFTNAPEVSPSGTTGWQDVDISSHTGSDTAIGIFAEQITIGGEYRYWGYRKKGSTDDRKNSCRRHSGGVCGVDGSEIFQIFRDNSSAKTYLLGYVKANMVFDTNAPEITPAASGVISDLDTLPSGATGGFIEFHQYGYKFLLRKKGSTENIYLPARRKGFAIVECDENGVIQGESENISWMRFYRIGYTIGGGGTVIDAAAADGIKTSDTPSRTAIYETVIVDGVKMSDSDQTLATLLAAIADGAKFSDSGQALATLLTAAADGVKLSDSGVASAIFSTQAVDGVKFSDSAIGQVVSIVLALASDGVKLSDTPASSAILQMIISDGAKFSDLPDVTALLNAGAADGVKLSDTTNWQQIVEALAADGVKLSDSGIATMKLLALLSDGVKLSDTGAASLVINVSVADGAKFSDAVQAVMILQAAVADGVKFSDLTSEVSTLPTGEVTVTFRIKSTSITFVLKGPKSTFDLKGPKTEIS